MGEADAAEEGSRPAIVVVNTYLGDPIGILGLRVVNEICRERNVDLVGICDYSDWAPGITTYGVELIRSLDCRGILVLRGGATLARHEAVTGLGLPVVCLDHRQEGWTIVHRDRSTAIYQLVEHLVDEHGRRRPAAVFADEHDRELVRELLAERGLPTDKIIAGARRGSGEGRILEACLAGRAPDAIILEDAPLARSLMGALQGRGYLVPQDIAIAVAGDYLLNPTMLPAITGLGPAFEEQVACATELLLDHVIDGRPLEESRLPAEVQPHQSCGCVATRLPADYGDEEEAVGFLFEKRSEIANQMQQEGQVSDELIQGRSLRPWIEGLLGAAYNLLEEADESQLFAVSGGDIDRLPEYLVHARRRMLWVLQDALLGVLPEGPIRERVAAFLRLQWKAFADRGTIPPGYYGDLEHVKLSRLMRLRNALHADVDPARRLQVTAAATHEIGVQGLMVLARLRTDAPRAWTRDDVLVAAANGRTLDLGTAEPQAPLDPLTLAHHLRVGDEAVSLMLMSLTSPDGSHEGLLVADGRVNGQALEYLREAFGPQVFSQLATEVERRQAEALDDERRLLRAVIDSVPDPIFVKDTESRFLLANAACLKEMKFTDPDELLGKSDAEVMDAETAGRWRKQEQGIIAGGEAEFSTPDLGADGRSYLVSKIPIRDRAGRVTGLVGVKHDVSELKAAESQVQEKDELLQRAHKFEAIGRLASGITHDFNNVLTIIQNYAELIGRHPRGETVERNAATITEASRRATRLTRDLLSFSSAQSLEPRPCDLNKLIEQADSLLHGAAGEQVDLVYSLAAEVCPILIDPSALEQILVNFTVNARDAMPQGGTLTFSTEVVNLESGRRRSTLGPGRYVRMAVTDTGTGIAPEHLPSIFDPFFTTKEADKGTGLGLSTAYGILKQAGGDVEVKSVVGQGTTFTVWLPHAGEEDYAAADVAVATEPVRGDETILVVDDDPVVCRVVCDVLAGTDYTVHSATSPEEALARAAEVGADLDLLITDVMMPGTNGIQLALELREERPRLKVLFMSGVADAALREVDQQENLAHFLAKPFTSQELHDKVREALETSTKIYRRRSTRRYRHDSSSYT